MTNDDTKVIGWFAYASRTEVVCTEVDACVISGSEEAMRDYARELQPEGVGGSHTIRKTRFTEIIQGLNAGAAYAFDREAYGRFLPLGRTRGLQLAEGNFNKKGRRFFVVRLRFL